MALRIVTSPAVEPITLAEAKDHLRVDHDDEDDYIATLIKAARQYCDGPEGILRRALVSQEWELVLDRFPCVEIQIPLGLLRSITSIKYDDVNGDEQTLAADQYTVDTANVPGWVLPGDSGWPPTMDAVNAVRIIFVAGYEPDAGSPVDETANIPETIKMAMKLLLSHWFQSREAASIESLSEPPFAVSALLAPYRVYL